MVCSLMPRSLAPRRPSGRRRPDRGRGGGTRADSCGHDGLRRLLERSILQRPDAIGPRADQSLHPSRMRFGHVPSRALSTGMLAGSCCAVYGVCEPMCPPAQPGVVFRAGGLGGGVRRTKTSTLSIATSRHTASARNSRISELTSHFARAFGPPRRHPRPIQSPGTRRREGFPKRRSGSRRSRNAVNSPKRG
jgi:hypothetical protein